MNEKQDLASLFSLLERPTEEFVSSPAFRQLEQKTEVIKHIEKFGLPEVNKLISCSELLSSLDWAEKYNPVRMIYLSFGELDVLGLILSYASSAKEFEEKILAVAGSDIISKIAYYFGSMTVQRDKEKKERSSLKGKITKAKKKLQETDGEEVSVEDDPSILEDEKHVEELDKSIAEADDFLNSFKHHYAAVKKYTALFSNAEKMSYMRECAYAAIDEIIPSHEEEFLLGYIENGILTKENTDDLKNYAFLLRLLECLDKKSYCDVAFPVLTKLYADGAIDFEDELVVNFVNTHSRLLAEFLEDRYTQDTNFIFDEENSLLIEYAIKGTINGCNDFTTWWNVLSDSSDWKCILSKTVEIYGLPIEVNASKLLHHVYGKSLNVFIELMNSDDAKNISLSSSEFISEYLGQEALESKDLVCGCIRNLEQTNRRLQRRLASKERELNRYSAELFSSIYSPLEQLENLAVNLRLSDREIKCSLVAGQMIQSISALREGLSAMGLETADEIENWQRQSIIEYDAEKHRMSSPVVNSGERVKLQTLGYVYTDDDGNKKVRAAEVYIPAPIEEKQSSQNDSLRSEHKKNKGYTEEQRKNNDKKGKNGCANNKSNRWQNPFEQRNRKKKNKKNSEREIKDDL